MGDWCAVNPRRLSYTLALCGAGALLLWVLWVPSPTPCWAQPVEPPPLSVVETAKRVGRLEVGLQLQKVKVDRAKALLNQEVGLFRQIEAELRRLTLDLTMRTSDGGTSGTLIKEIGR